MDDGSLAGVSRVGELCGERGRARFVRQKNLQLEGGVLISPITAGLRPCHSEKANRGDKSLYTLFKLQEELSCFFFLRRRNRIRIRQNHRTSLRLFRGIPAYSTAIDISCAVGDLANGIPRLPSFHHERHSLSR